MSEPARDLHALAQRSADADLASLLKAKETARANLARENTAKNIATFNAATKALENAMQHKGPEEAQQSPTPSGFSTLEAVRRFLDEQGYMVSKSAIARHKFLPGGPRPDQDGTFSQKEALRYAKAFDLKVKATGLRKSEAAVLEQSQLRDARIDLVREQALLARRKREVEEGKWVLKSSVGQGLAARAVMLKTGLKQLATSGVGEWVHLVSGDPLRIPDLLRMVLEGLDRVLDDYARADGVVLVFNGPEEEAEEEVVTEQETEEVGA